MSVWQSGGLTIWGFQPIAMILNQIFQDLNEVLTFQPFENWLKTIVTNKKHERDRFRSDLVASYDIESNSYFLTMIRLFSQYGSTNRSSTVKPRENVHPKCEDLLINRGVDRWRSYSAHCLKSRGCLRRALGSLGGVSLIRADFVFMTETYAYRGIISAD